MTLAEHPTIPSRRRGPRTRALAVVAAALAVVALVGWTLAAVARDRVGGTVLGMALAGVVALVSGAVVVAGSLAGRARGSGLREELPHVLLGAAVVVWGIGQVLLSRQITPDGRRTFGAGDLVSSLALPTVVAALAVVPRQSRVSRPTLRLALDGLLVTLACSLGAWWLLLQPALPDPAHPGGSAASGVVMAAFDLGTVALMALAWARDRRRGAGLLTVGLLLQAVADLPTLPAVVGDHALPWISGPVWCVALPLVAVGIARYVTRRSDDRGVTVLEDVAESTVTMVATLVVLVGLAVLVVVPVEHRWTPVAAVLASACLALLVGREVLNSVVRQRMVGWLNTEALRDVLTGLPNRSALTARIRGLDRSRPWTLLTVDLDDFKEVNELFGSAAGDEIIVLVAVALQRGTPPQGLVARLGGDEFGVLAPGTVEDGERLAGELRSALQRITTTHGGRGLPVSIGVGRVLADDAPDDASDGPARGTARGGRPRDGAEPAPQPRDRLNALLESEAALRAAKAAGGNRIALYPGAVEQARKRRIVLERRLRRAIDAGSLEMHAQPLVDLRTGRVAGFESLARWTDEVLGPVSPAEFVPVAEQTGLVTALGEFALRNTLLQAKAGGVVGQPVELGVNVSPIQLRNPSFAPMVVDLVQELGIAPHQLLLEVTEAILVDEDDPASGALSLLNEAGVQLAIDDFGTGYSALGYLRRIPMDELKIDRSWVVAAVTDNRTRDIVGGVVQLAHTLGAIVVMEGIEDEETAQVCRDLDADLGQGWHFGRPQPWQVAAAELAAAPVRVTPGGAGGRPSTPAGRPAARS